MHEREALVKTALEEVLKDEGKAFAEGLASAESKNAFYQEIPVLRDHRRICSTTLMLRILSSMP